MQIDNDHVFLYNYENVVIIVIIDLYLQACVALPDEKYQPHSVLSQPSGYSAEYLGWLVRQGRIEAIKRGGCWYSTLDAVQKYKAEVEAGIIPKGRPRPAEQDGNELAQS